MRKIFENIEEIQRIKKKYVTLGLIKEQGIINVKYDDGQEEVVDANASEMTEQNINVTDPAGQQTQVDPNATTNTTQGGDQGTANPPAEESKPKTEEEFPEQYSCVKGGKFGISDDKKFSYYVLDDHWFWDDGEVYLFNDMGVNADSPENDFNVRNYFCKNGKYRVKYKSKSKFPMTIYHYNKTLVGKLQECLGDLKVDGYFGKKTFDKLKEKNYLTEGRYLSKETYDKIVEKCGQSDEAVNQTDQEKPKEEQKPVNKWVESTDTELKSKFDSKFPCLTELKVFTKTTDEGTTQVVKKETNLEDETVMYTLRGFYYYYGADKKIKDKGTFKCPEESKKPETGSTPGGESTTTTNTGGETTTTAGGENKPTQ